MVVIVPFDVAVVEALVGYDMLTISPVVYLEVSLTVIETVKSLILIDLLQAA